MVGKIFVQYLIEQECSTDALILLQNVQVLTRIRSRKVPDNKIQERRSISGSEGKCK